MYLDSLVLRRISGFCRYKDLRSLIILVPGELRKDIDEIIDFMPEYYYLLSRITRIRLPEKEQVIGQCPKSSYLYTLTILRGRWPIEDNREEKENVISRNPYIYKKYIQEVINR